MATTTNVDPLVVGRVIGDVVDMFVPAVSMSVHYGTKHVNNGCDIKPSLAAVAPRVAITGFPDQLYTLVMTDPDAPSPSEPALREWVHWIVTDIPGCCGDAGSRGREVLAYGGPRPPIGIHRYVLVLFRQEGGSLEGLQPPPIRSRFCTRVFARELNLGMPVATVYFNAHKEPSSHRSKQQQQRHHS